MKLFGLVGKTLTHSFSKNYFQEKFARERLADCKYENFELPAIDDLPLLITSNPDLRGVNVTIPYKEDVVAMLDDKNEIVEEIKACNCVRIDDGKLSGFNTDVIGFRQSIEPKLERHHKKALILGTGGASKAIAYVLTQLGIEYCFVSRQKVENELGYEDVGDDVLRNYHLIINTTPLGMYPNVDSDPQIPYQYLTSKHFLFDLVYNPEKTKFLIEGQKRGAQIENGYEMLILQAEESWRIWNQLTNTA